MVDQAVSTQDTKERALIFAVGDRLPVDELRECIAMALTYHLAVPGHQVGDTRLMGGWRPSEPWLRW